MYTSPGGYFTSSTLFKTSLLTIAFSTLYIEKIENTTVFHPKQRTAGDKPMAEVKMKPVIAKKRKTLYLTFDDGPNKGTKKVMDIMEAEQIPVTMFIIGAHVYGSAEQKKIFDSLVSNTLFELANHSYSHAFENKYRQFYDLPDSMVKDFVRCADSLGLTSNIVRTPGRNIWRTKNITSTDIVSSGAAADSLQKNGFTAMGWDLEWHFTSDQMLVQSDTLLMRQIDSLFAKNKTKLSGQLVLLAHDRTFLSAADSSALHRLIIELKKRDEFDFETISKYPGVSSL